MPLNQELLRFAQEMTGLSDPMTKSANPAAMDPAAMAGMDPAAMGMGPPPIDPTAAPPPAGPMGGAPAGPPPGAAPVPAQAPPSVSAGGAGKKMKPEEISMSYRMYNIQVQLTAILNALGVKIPPEALLTPPGPDGVPIPEQAAPGAGSPVDLATQQQSQAAPPADPGAGQQASAIQPIEPIQGAVPSGEKVASATDFVDQGLTIGSSTEALSQEKQADDIIPLSALPPTVSPTYDEIIGTKPVLDSADAIAQMLRENTAA